MTEDQRLLHQYQRQGSKLALDELIRRHVALVYSSALRQVRDAHLAEDITQAVFLVLTQKAKTIRNGVAISGWLMAVTRRAAVDAMRKEAAERRQQQMAARPESSAIAHDAAWNEIAPLLDTAVNNLSAIDRDAVVMRFFEDRSFAEVGLTLRLSEEAARKRVKRALDRLRKLLTRYGIQQSADVLGAVLVARAITPAHMRSPAIASGTNPKSVAIAKGVIHMMARTKAAMTIVTIAGAVLLTAGGATMLVRATKDQQRPSAPHSLSVSDFAAKTVDVTGQIVDESGQPIAYARVIPRIENSNNPIHTARSNASGAFLLHNISSGSATLLITCKGYAPQLRDIQADAQMAPIRVVLSSGSVLHGQVMDPFGKPLANATVSLIWWRLGPAPFLMTNTNADGKFQMADIPKDEMSLGAFKDDFTSQQLALPAPPGDTVITLKTSGVPTISGHVTDALTHQPISRFEVMGGAKWLNSPSPHFHGITVFHSGTYQLVLRSGGDIEAHYLRIEADGYRPMISPPLHESGTQDFSLQPAPAWTGHVLQPDGQPAVGTPVALDLDDPIIFNDGKLLMDVMLHYKPMVTANDGSFELRQQIDPFELWAWSEVGVAHLKRDKPAGENLEMKLEPWATLRLKIPWVVGNNQPLKIFAKSPTNPGERGWTYSVTPEADGTVTIDRLPPMPEGIAEVQLARPKPQWESGPAVLAHIVPGKTTELDLTEGITVTGHVAGDSPMLFLSPIPDKPAGQLPTDWLAAAKLMPAVLHYAARFDSSGAFSIEGVKPGQYSYIARPDRSRGKIEGWGLLNISASVDGHAVDVGELTVSKVVTLTNGLPAPLVLGRTLEGKPILTADLHGKFIVWVVLDSLPRSAPALPDLAELAATFGTDKRVALVGINDIQITSILRRPPTLGEGWNNGYFSGIDAALFDALPDSSNWPAILIIGPDGRVLATGLSSGETAAKLTGLLRGQTP